MMTAMSVVSMLGPSGCAVTVGAGAAMLFALAVRARVRRGQRWPRAVVGVAGTVCARTADMVVIAWSVAVIVVMSAVTVALWLIAAVFFCMAPLALIAGISGVDRAPRYHGPGGYYRDAHRW